MCPDGVPQYLTRIVASPLAWIGSAADQEKIWELASQRLAEQSGRTGMGAIDREFCIPLLDPTMQELYLQIHEPALTEDNLGLKTWGTSFTLAKHLVHLQKHFAYLSKGSEPRQGQPSSRQSPIRVLELGAGTGVLGLAFAAVFKTHVLMTDLPTIVGNLRRSAEANASAINHQGSRAKTSVGMLDWSWPALLQPLSSEERAGNGDEMLRFDTIIAADPIYSSLHPALLTDTINARLSLSGPAKVFVAYPLRAEYQAQINELSELLTHKCQLSLSIRDRLKGSDDWKEEDELVVEYNIYTREF